MRALKVMLASLVVALVAVVIMRPQPATAADGATVTRSDTGCTIFSPFGVVVASLQDVQTPSGNEKVSCHGQLPAGTAGPSHAFVLHGAGCTGFTGGGSADLQITPSGEVNATCQIRP